MHGIHDRDLRFRHLELKIGIMVAVVVVGIAAVFAAIAAKKEVFTHKLQVHFVSPSGVGFAEGMAVKLSGFKIGWVKSLELTETADVKVTLEINRRYDRWLRQGAVARLAKEGLIGESSVEVAMGDAAQPMLKEGDRIPYERTPGLEELVHEVKPILNQVREVVQYINDPKGDLKVAVANFRALAGGLRETTGDLNTLVRDTRSGVNTLLTGTRTELSGLIQQTSETVVHIDALVSSLNDRTGPALTSAAAAMKTLEDLTLKLEPVVARVQAVAVKTESVVDDFKAISSGFAAEVPRVRQILTDAGEVAREGRGMIKGAREVWPLSLIAPPPAAPGLLPLESDEIDRKAR